MAVIHPQTLNLMQTSLRLLLVVWVAAWVGAPRLSAEPSSAKKKQAATKQAPAATKPKPQTDTDAGKASADDDETGPVMTPAAVSTISVEDIRDFDKYPKQIQSLVQSSMALTRLELGYLYGSHEPSKGGMDCSGTIYHVLHFQGLKDVPRQSDEMCNWVDKKSQLHLTPTATSFDSEEFADLKPGDLLFWTNTTQTTRKLPVTHVMIYLGKLKKSGRRVVFGSSDGRSFHGERRSGVSVFDFTLPRDGSPSRFYGYGPSPGLLPPEPKPPEPERPVIAAVMPPPAPAVKEAPVSKELTAVKAAPADKTASAPKTSTASKQTPESKPSVALKESATPKDSPAVKEEAPAPKEEVRKAIAMNTDGAAGKTDTEIKKTVASADTPAKTSSSTTSKAKTTATKKKTSSSNVSTTRRRAPAAPQKSAIEQRIDRAVSSVRRFFQQ